MYVSSPRIKWNRENLTPRKIFHANHFCCDYGINVHFNKSQLVSQYDHANFSQQPLNIYAWSFWEEVQEDLEWASSSYTSNLYVA